MVSKVFLAAKDKHPLFLPTNQLLVTLQFFKYEQLPNLIWVEKIRDYDVHQAHHSTSQSPNQGEKMALSAFLNYSFKDDLSF